MALPLIPLLMAAANAAPALMKFIGAGETAEKVAQEVSDLAGVVTGNQVPPEKRMEVIMQDEQLKREFQIRVNEQMKSWDEMFLKDTQSARDRDAKLRAAGQRNIRADTMYVLAVLVVAGIFIAIWITPNIDEFVKGVVTLLLGRFLGYIDQIYSFEFGTTRSSKQKDSTIEKLTGENNGRRT